MFVEDIKVTEADGFHIIATGKDIGIEFIIIFAYGVRRESGRPI
jgi:hypothetical protein